MTGYDGLIDFIFFAAKTGILILFILYLLCNFVLLYPLWKIRNVPPGPWGIPFFGYWPFLKNEGGHLQLQKFTEKYGEIFSMTVTGNLFVCLSSVKVLKEAHLTKADCFGDRFTDFSLLNLSFEGAVTMVNGESWKVQRKFFSQKFKEYGMLAVKENTSGSFYSALAEVVEELRATEGQPTSITDLVTIKCSSIIRRILFNDQGITEDELKELNKEYVPVLESMTYKNLFLMGNIARFAIFPFMPSYCSMLRGHNRIQEILNNIIQRHKSSFDANQILDIIDCFYKEKREKELRGDPTAKHFTDKALLSSVYQFITDGVLTVAYFISIMLQSLADHPDDQEKIYEEIMEVVGPSRQPTIEDKSNLPYTNSYIYEVIRYSEIFPMFPSMKCIKETTVQGHRIPKGAITAVNVWSAHHDPQVYEDPYTFDASRFISKPGKQRPPLPVMFGIGKRACMGEPFTMIETFLFLTTIVKNFRLTPPGTGTSANFLKAGDIVICAQART